MECQGAFTTVMYDLPENLTLVPSQLLGSVTEKHDISPSAVRVSQLIMHLKGFSANGLADLDEMQVGEVGVGAEAWICDA